ncbi:hypothetical protein CBR_g39163 [Chara braunii]|uniref:Uncharacterized protein n=1 Tax=Chara braunii TaxID=69332 RepID=A0A388LR29_CHABU|nr:hypothetical protein CBR_g39163 [Chara braunii]|eukprot:GBG84786.1 hypothetical protein CBR_g39163 [Chara braunii]
MAARIRDGGLGTSNRNEPNGILQALAQGTSTSNAIVPYQAPQDRSFGGNNGSYNRGGNFNYCGGYSDGQRYSRPWSGGYRDRERDNKLDGMYGLLSEQMEEREQKKKESAQLKLLAEEKKRLQAEEEKKQQAIKEREQQEGKLGKIVRTSVQAVCEAALGRKVHIPEDEDYEISRLGKELEDLRTKSSEASSSSREDDSRLEALRKEKEALLKMRNQETEEERLRKEIAQLRSRNGPDKPNNLKEDEILALQLQNKESNAFRTVLEGKNAEASALQSENKHLKKDFSELRDEVLALRGKRDAGAVTEKSPLDEPARGKPRAGPSSTAMYTPKDLGDLQKAYKESLAGKEMALKEAQMLKERMPHKHLILEGTSEGLDWPPTRKF